MDRESRSIDLLALYAEDKRAQLVSAHRSYVTRLRQAVALFTCAFIIAGACLTISVWLRQRNDIGLAHDVISFVATSMIAVVALALAYANLGAILRERRRHRYELDLLAQQVSSYHVSRPSGRPPADRASTYQIERLQARVETITESIQGRRDW